jgi:hypothetical protein
MLQPDPSVDSALQVALERMQEVVTTMRAGERHAARTRACLHDLLQQFATSSQVTPAQRVQLQHLLTLVEAVSPVGTPRSKQRASPLTPAGGEPEDERAIAHSLLNVRDMNMICQEYGDVYALVEGEKRRRKINRARRRQGVLEIRTAARDEWKGPVAWIEWVNGLGEPVRYLATAIR